MRWWIPKLAWISSSIFNRNLFYLLVILLLLWMILQWLIYHPKFLWMLLNTWNITIDVISLILHHGINILRNLGSTRTSCAFYAFNRPVHYDLSLILSLIIVNYFRKIEWMFFFLARNYELSSCCMWWNSV